MTDTAGTPSAAPTDHLDPQARDATGVEPAAAAPNRSTLPEAPSDAQAAGDHVRAVDADLVKTTSNVDATDAPGDATTAAVRRGEGHAEAPATPAQSEPAPPQLRSDVFGRVGFPPVDLQARIKASQSPLAADPEFALGMFKVPMDSAKGKAIRQTANRIYKIAFPSGRVLQLTFDEMLAHLEEFVHKTRWDKISDKTDVYDPILQVELVARAVRDAIKRVEMTFPVVPAHAWKRMTPEVAGMMFPFGFMESTSEQVSAGHDIDCGTVGQVIETLPTMREALLGGLKSGVYRAVAEEAVKMLSALQVILHAGLQTLMSKVSGEYRQSTLLLRCDFDKPGSYWATNVFNQGVKAPAGPLNFAWEHFDKACELLDDKQRATKVYSELKAARDAVRGDKPDYRIPDNYSGHTRHHRDLLARWNSHHPEPLPPVADPDAFDLYIRQYDEETKAASASAEPATPAPRADNGKAVSKVTFGFDFDFAASSVPPEVKTHEVDGEAAFAGLVLSPGDPGSEIHAPADTATANVGPGLGEPTTSADDDQDGTIPPDGPTG